MPRCAKDSASGRCTLQAAVPTAVGMKHEAAKRREEDKLSRITRTVFIFPLTSAPIYPYCTHPHPTPLPSHTLSPGPRRSATCRAPQSRRGLAVCVYIHISRDANFCCRAMRFFMSCQRLRAVAGRRRRSGDCSAFTRQQFKKPTDIEGRHFLWQKF